MLIKLIGTVILLLSGGALSLSLCRFQRKRLETIDGFLSLLFHIKGQIDCFARPIGEILHTLPPAILRSCNCPRGADSLDELIEESKPYLDEEPMRLLSSFESEFGSTFREEQMRRCDYYIGALGEKRRALEPKVAAKMRSGSTLCICLCLSLTVLLW